MRQWSMIVFAAIVILAAVTAVSLSSRRTAVETDLEAYKSELRRQGEPLNFGELESGGTGDGRVDLSRFEAAAARLPTGVVGLGDLALMRYAAPGTASVGWLADRPPFNDYVTNPVITWDDLTRRAEEAAGLRRELVWSTQDPVLRFGRTYGELANRRLVDELVLKRQAARWLAGAALVELHAGRHASALECLEAVLGITQMQRDEYSLVTQMHRIALGSLALSLTWELLQREGWDDAQLARLQERWAEVDFLEALGRGLQAERAWFSQCMLEIEGRRGGGMVNENGGMGEWIGSRVHSWLWHPPAEELFYLRNIQPILDQVRSLAAEEPTADVKSELDNLEIALDQANGGWLRRRQHALSLMSLPNAQRAVPRALESEAQRRLTLAAVALARHDIARGGHPSSLDQLVPEYLRAVPIDPLAGEPMRYRLHSDGTFTLYSVGRDGVDDGGDPTLTSSARTAGLWEGRDAVWPSAGR
jgi:hypothetical protein